MSRLRANLGYALSLPERTLRAAAAGLGGLLYEATQVLLPGWLRRSRLYRTIVAGTLRIAIELVGGATSVLPSDEVTAQELAKRKAAGTGIEMVGLMFVGWSPLWLFAATADVTGGTRTSWQDLRRQATALPNAKRLADLYAGLKQVTKKEGRSLRSVSTLIAAGAVRAGVQIGQVHIVDYYEGALLPSPGKDWRSMRGG